jgi:hypothetical protein
MLRNTAKSSARSACLAHHGTKILCFALCAQAWVALGCGARTTDELGGLAGESGESGAADTAGQGGMQAGGGSSGSGDIEMGTSGSGGPSGEGGIGGVGGGSGAGGLGGSGGASGLGGGPPANDEQACRMLWAPGFGACFSDEAPGALTPSDMFSGVVESIDRAAPSCQGFGDTNASGGMHSITVTDGERSLVITLRLPWSEPLVAVGETIQVEKDYGWGQWSPSTGRLVLRDAEGTVLLWLERVLSGPESLIPPAGMSAVDGAIACSYDDSCGIRTRKSLLVRADDAQADIPYGGSADVGDYVFLNGGDTDFEFTGGCTDTGSSHVIFVAAVRGSQASLAARDIGPCGGESCGLNEYCAGPNADRCDGESAEAECSTAASDCGTDCPMVCGCDGKPYCNACRAQQAGVAVNEGDISCIEAGCNGEDGIAMAGPCSVDWSCYGQQYSYDCSEVGDLQRCLCRIGDEVVASVDITDLQCATAASACGFPPLPF